MALNLNRGPLTWAPVALLRPYRVQTRCRIPTRISHIFGINALPNAKTTRLERPPLQFNRGLRLIEIQYRCRAATLRRSLPAR